MLNVLKKVDKGIEWAQIIFCGLLMFAMMWTVFFMVFFRYVLNNSIVWAEEILRYMMMWAVLVGAGLTTRDDQHVCIDLVQSILNRWPKARAIHYIFTRLVVFVFLIYLCGPTMDLIEKTGNSTATSVTWLHKSVIYVAFIAGAISINLSLLGQVPRKIYNILHGIEDDEMIIEAQAKAAEYDRQLEEAEKAKAAVQADPENAEGKSENPEKDKDDGGDRA